ncbi:unnamed protein product [Cladocopium goreaui]|uniref:Methyltransferase n=1 Tax=Cladocopium goreaui TaxID=2562237 RepID=A0A9P1G744_9DINO|nr:unnamed protein product [Cladocopium goreaui]
MRKGGAFGNELFIVAKALVAAQRLQYPVLLTRRAGAMGKAQSEAANPAASLPAKQPWPSKSGGGDVSWLRISHSLREKFWDDRSTGAETGYGCLELLRKQKRVMDPGAGGFHQDLGEWKEPPLSWRPLLAEAFQVDMPQMKTEVIMPGNEDLVMYFRPYRRKQIFDLRGDHAFLTSPPFAFFDFAVQQHRRDFPSGKLLVIAEPSMRSHPTVGRLCSELGAAVVTDMDQAGKQAWLADWVWLRSAKHLVLSPSTFVWWAAFLSEALRIYVPIFPGIAALPWCKLLPSGDPRYLFYDFWTNTTFTDGSVAKTHCQEYFHCKADECVVKKHRTAMASLYPELLELNQQDADFLNASAAKMGATSLGGTAVAEASTAAATDASRNVPAATATAATAMDKGTDLEAVLNTTPGPIPRHLVLQRHAGLYLDKSLQPEFKDIVLLTAANSAYMDFLQNWECHAKRLALDWVVLALDQEAYQVLSTSARVLLATGSTSGSLEYLSKGFNLMSLNTLATVFEVMKEGFDVVFTDSDNVFLSDPFAAGTRTNCGGRSG